MTTILSDEWGRACDGRCHNAEQDECDCICAGRYHGSGNEAEEQVVEDVQNGVAFPPWINFETLEEVG